MESCELLNSGEQSVRTEPMGSHLTQVLGTVIGGGQ
jgi:hypothetical protein